MHHKRQRVWIVCSKHSEMDSDARRVRGRKRASTLSTSLFVYFIFRRLTLSTWFSTTRDPGTVHLMTPQVGTPGNCCWGGGGVPHGSPNSDHISEQKCDFPHPFSDPQVVSKRNITSWNKTEIMSSLQQKYFLKSISNSHITLSFLFIWKCLTTNTLIHNRSSLVHHTQFQTKMGKIYTRF